MIGELKSRQALFHSRLRVLEDWHLSGAWKNWKRQIARIVFWLLVVNWWQHRYNQKSIPSTTAEVLSVQLPHLRRYRKGTWLERKEHNRKKTQWTSHWKKICPIACSPSWPGGIYMGSTSSKCLHKSVMESNRIKSDTEKKHRYLLLCEYIGNLWNISRKGFALSANAFWIMCGLLYCK